MGRSISPMREETIAGSDPRIAPRLIVPMSLQLAITRRVALQQSSPPLHQPRVILKEKRKFEKGKSLNCMCANSKLSQQRGSPQPSVPELRLAVAVALSIATLGLLSKIPSLPRAGPSQCRAYRLPSPVWWPTGSPTGKPRDARWPASDGERRSAGPCPRIREIRGPRRLPGTETDRSVSPKLAAVLAPTRSAALPRVAHDSRNETPLFCQAGS